MPSQREMPRRPDDPAVCGVVVVDKPAGLTSFDVVARVRRLFGVRRVGHTGTLDPLATGVLGVCVGEATRVAELLTASDKTYMARALLGVTTDSDDITGTTLATREVSLSDADVAAALVPLRGDIAQVPPAFSAIHIDGVRAYTRARRGEQVKMPERRVHVAELRAGPISRDRDGLVVDLCVRCSKGTYIRSLIRDLGNMLGCGATMKALRRMRVGSMALGDAHRLASLQQLEPPARRALLSPIAAVLDRPKFEATAADVEDLAHGRSVSVQLPDASVALAVVGERTVALGAVEQLVFRPKRVLAGQLQWVRAAGEHR